MRIAHISDIHIRNLKFHEDYRRVFDNFYEKLDELKVDLVVNTGDTAHTKTVISPEFVEMASEMTAQIAHRAHYIIVLGNHDLNLMNEDRQDAITPIIQALDLKNVYLLKNSGPFGLGDMKRPELDKFTFWNYGIADVQNWPRKLHESYHNDTNIGLFHGSIKNCVTDSNFRMTDVEYDQDIFEGMDFVMMGDIHKRQSFNDGRAWYAGSMIQQNFGEDPDKGFLLWDIEDKDKWNVEFHELKGNRRFYTVKLPEDLRLPEMNIEPDSRIRISPPRQLTLVEQKTIEKLVKKKFNPHDVITLGTQNIGQMFTEASGSGFKIENLRDQGIQENLLRKFLDGKKVTPEVFDKVIELNKKYHLMVEQKDETARGVNWKILKMGWNNLYNYGEGNVIDFSQVKGLTGIFAPNASGKSGMIDAITIGMFDSNTKEVSKNVHLINDNRDKAVVIMELLANNERYSIQRDIERIKVGKRKGEEKEWGKTTLEFQRLDRDGGTENLVAELRPETEKRIRRRFGNFDDFLLTSLFAQWDPMDIIMCKETDRKRILFRFLDLDMFEEKAKIAKEESKEWIEKLADFEENGYEKIFEELKEEQENDSVQLTSLESFKEKQKEEISKLYDRIERLASQIIPTNTSFRKIEANSLVRIEKEIESYREKLNSKQLQIEGLKKQLEEFKQVDYNSEYVDKQVEKLEEFEAALFSIQVSVKDHQRQVDEKKKQSALLDKVPCGDQFIDCQFLVNAFAAKKELPEHLKNLTEVEMEALRLRTEIVKLEVYRVQKEKYLGQVEEADKLETSLKMADLEQKNMLLTIDKMESELKESRVEMERYEQAKRDLEKNEVIQHEIGELKEELSEKEKGLKSWEGQIAEMNQALGARKMDMERIQKQMDAMKQVRDTCSAFEHFLDAMGKDGIALQVLTQKLPVINEEINKILSSACEFGVYIEYDKEDQSIRLYIQYGQYKSRLLELGSGAEKFLASVAIRSALLSISNLPRSNMFIIDEGFGKLDPSNLEAIQRMFDYLKSVFDHVIVISHTDLMKDMVDNMIEITQDDNGCAHVEIGG